MSDQTPLEYGHFGVDKIGESVYTIYANRTACILVQEAPVEKNIAIYTCSDPVGTTFLALFKALDIIGDEYAQIFIDNTIVLDSLIGRKPCKLYKKYESGILDALSYKQVTFHGYYDTTKYKTIMLDMMEGR